MDKKKLWEILKPILKIGFTVLALWLVYTKVDIAALGKLWKEANGWLLIPAVFTFIISQIISSFRVLNYFKNIGLPITVLANMRLYLLGMFYNLFLPGGIGGDGYKILVLKKQYNSTHKEVFSAVFFDRVSGLWALGLLLTVFGLFLPEVADYKWWVLTAFILGSVAYYGVLHFFFHRMVQRFGAAHLLAIGVQAFQLVTVALILAALGCQTSYWPYFTIFLLSSLASLFPFSVGGLGAREVAIVWGATTFGLDKDLSVSVSLCFYVITMALALTAIAILFGKERRQKNAADIKDV